MNAPLFKAFMQQNMDNQKQLAEALGISLSNLNAKVNGKNTCFRQNEISTIKDRYGLTADEVDRIFFANRLS